MNNTLSIEILKDGTNAKIYKSGKEIAIKDLYRLAKKENAKIVRFETKENGKTLLLGYLAVGGEARFERAIRHSAKAKIRFR